MKETRFIAQNKEKWREAETLLESQVKDPEKLSNLFIQVVDDLSYSRTYYPNRSVRVYLNKIARQYFSIIYSHKKEKHNAFMLFWLDELPQIIIYCRRELMISLLVFVVAMAIGVFSSVNDPQFVNTILGDDYVSMTEKNIAAGDPMAVYKQRNELDMFLGITLNNLMVAFRTYVLGLFLGIGTLASLLGNGIMVGCFQYFFIQRDLFIESALSIWLHGTLEISSIVLAGGAGLTLARGLIFPGTYSRIQSLQISGIRSLKFMLGITPVFVLAAIIESFLTRYTDAPVVVSVTLIALSAAFIIGYFVVYPWMKLRSGFAVPIKEVRLQPSISEPVNFSRIKNNADVLKDTFLFYARSNAQFLPWIFFVSIGVSVCFFAFEQDAPVFLAETEWWETLFSNVFFALNTPSMPFILINGTALGLVVYRSMQLIDSESKSIKPVFDLKALGQILLITSSFFGLIYLGFLGIFTLVSVFGILIFCCFILLTEKTDFMYGFSRSWELYGKNSNQGLGLQFIGLLLAFSFLLLLSAPLIYIHMNVIEWNFVADDPWSKNLIHFLEIFIKTFSFYLIVPLVCASLSYLYFSQEEIVSANSLKEAIARMGTRASKINRR
jgi:uncharacterized membrane protein SpoIIM required for sporulation